MSSRSNRKKGHKGHLTVNKDHETVKKFLERSCKLSGKGNGCNAENHFFITIAT